MFRPQNGTTKIAHEKNACTGGFKRTCVWYTLLFIRTANFGSQAVRSYFFTIWDLPSCSSISINAGSFAVQFGDHLRSLSHLRAGIIWGPVQIAIVAILKMLDLVWPRNTDHGESAGETRSRGRGRGRSLTSPQAPLLSSERNKIHPRQNQLKWKETDKAIIKSVYYYPILHILYTISTANGRWVESQQTFQLYFLLPYFFGKK